MIGIKISKEDSSVKKGSDEQYVDTSTPLFKLYRSSSGEQVFSSTVLSGGGYSFPIPHNLGYIPMFFLFADRSHLSTRKLVLNQDTNFGDTTLWTCYATAQDIVVTVSAPSATPVTGAFGYNYLIFYDKAG